MSVGTNAEGISETNTQRRSEARLRGCVELLPQLPQNKKSLWKQGLFYCPSHSFPRSAGSEYLPYKQRVGGTNAEGISETNTQRRSEARLRECVELLPQLPQKKKSLWKQGLFYCPSHSFPRSAGSAHLPYTQRVGGANAEGLSETNTQRRSEARLRGCVELLPQLPQNKKSLWKQRLFFIGDFPILFPQSRTLQAEGQGTNAEGLSETNTQRRSEARLRGCVELTPKASAELLPQLPQKRPSNEGLFYCPLSSNAFRAGISRLTACKKRIEVWF